MALRWTKEKKTQTNGKQEKKRSHKTPKLSHKQKQQQLDDDSGWKTKRKKSDEIADAQTGFQDDCKENIKMS